MPEAVTALVLLAGILSLSAAAGAALELLAARLLRPLYRRRASLLMRRDRELQKQNNRQWLRRRLCAQDSAVSRLTGPAGKL